jgi:hypothetical protein
VRKWLRRWLAPAVIEVDLTRPKLDIDGRNALASLSGHPGLTFLIARLRLQRWYLESQLRGGSFASLRDFDQAQSGVRWVNWLEKQIEEITNPVKRETARLTDEDLESFAKAQAALELVGQSKQ